MSRQRPFRIALIGWGAIARRFAQLVSERNGARVMLCAIGLREGSAHHGAPEGAAILTDPARLAATQPDLVIEAAGRDAVAPWGAAALACSPAFAVASTSAFCDDAVLERLIAVADAHGSQLLIPPGALGGIDALAAAATLTVDEVRHSIVKPPLAWRGTAAEIMVALDAIAERTVIFAGSAREAARTFPQNANATIITALAGVGLDRTTVEIVADPAASGNRHHIAAAGAFGRMSVTLDNRPLAANPKSSELTALGLVRLAENRFRALVR